MQKKKKNEFNKCFCYSFMCFLLEKCSVGLNKISHTTIHDAHSQKKGTKAVTGAVPFQKVLLYLKGLHGTYLYNYGTNMHPLGTKVYLFEKVPPQ